MKAKIFLILLIAILKKSLNAAATTPASLAQLFDGTYQKKNHATETIITGAPLKPYSLSTFHSLAVTEDPLLALPLEKAAVADGAHALWKETVNKGGRMESGVYELKPQGKNRRYVLYLNSFLSGGNEAIIIYLEGKATPQQIKKLIKTISE